MRIKAYKINFLSITLGGLIWILFNAQYSFAQHITLNEHFNDGDISHDPAWTGSVNNFQITADSSKLLHLRAPSAGASYLSTVSQTAYGSWKFYIRLDFPPSGSNQARIFLISDKNDFTVNMNGYAIQIGESGSNDVVHLIKYENELASQNILSGTTNMSGGGDYSIKVTRDEKGKWTLYVSKGHQPFSEPEAIGFDNKIQSSKYFGIDLSYTSSRKDKFYFDDFVVTRNPAKLVALKTPSNNDILLTYSAPINQNSINPDIFSLNHKIGSPDNTNTVSDNIIDLHFLKSLHGGKYSLHISPLTDVYGQLTSDTSLTFRLFDRAQKRDIVINEIMYDPPADIPEYVELYNRRQKEFNLKNWRFEDGTDPIRRITNHDLILKPQSYIVLTSDTTTLIHYFGMNPYYQMAEFPNLNNDQDVVKLIDDTGQRIDSLTYFSNWGGKSKSLERRSDSLSSNYADNWGDSPALKGGTPGVPNAIAPDTTLPKLLSYKIPDDHHVNLHFSKIINPDIGSSIDDYIHTNPAIPINSGVITQSNITLTFTSRIKHRHDYSLTITGLRDLFSNIISDTTIHLYFNPDDFPPEVLMASFDSSYRQVAVNFNENITLTSQTGISANGIELQNFRVSKNDPTLLLVTYQGKPDKQSETRIHISSIADTAGNILSDTSLAIAHPPGFKTVVINEIMYNPITDKYDHKPDQCEYIEFYNTKNYTIDLARCYIHNEPDENGNTRNIYPLNNQYIRILPKSYLVFYADTSRSFSNSRVSRYFQIDQDSLSFYRINHTTLSLSSKKGAVYISDKYHHTIDSVYYSDSWQNPNIPVHKGISLERIDPAGDSNNADNWGSSADLYGGTPGKENSIRIHTVSPTQADAIKIEPNPFSPDHDGFQDNLSISYHLDEPDYLLRIRIFDRYGRIVRHLINNKRAGIKGSVIWNGLSDDGSMNRIGIYIILIEAYDGSGGRDHTFKKTVVLARKF
jgi:hypothetical protein